MRWIRREKEESDDEDAGGGDEDEDEGQKEGEEKWSFFGEKVFLNDLKENASNT